MIRLSIKHPSLLHSLIRRHQSSSLINKTKTTSTVSSQNTQTETQLTEKQAREHEVKSWYKTEKNPMVKPGEEMNMDVRASYDENTSLWSGTKEYKWRRIGAHKEKLQDKDGGLMREQHFQNERFLTPGEHFMVESLHYGKENIPNLPKLPSRASSQEIDEYINKHPRFTRLPQEAPGLVKLAKSGKAGNIFNLGMLRDYSEDQLNDAFELSIVIDDSKEAKVSSTFSRQTYYKEILKDMQVKNREEYLENPDSWQFNLGIRDPYGDNQKYNIFQRDYRSFLLDYSHFAPKYGYYSDSQNKFIWHYKYRIEQLDYMMFLASIAFFMTGLSILFPMGYKAFCSTVGIGSTLDGNTHNGKYAELADSDDSIEVNYDRQMTIDFNAMYINPMPFEFTTQQKRVTIYPGETSLVVERG